MRKAIFKTKITNESKYGKVAECQELFRMGRDSIMLIANEASAVVKIGQIVNIDIPKMIAYIEANYTGTDR